MLNEKTLGSFELKVVEDDSVEGLGFHNFTECGAQLRAIRQLNAHELNVMGFRDRPQKWSIDFPFRADPNGRTQGEKKLEC
jgi:hypothetical protein